MTTTRSHRTARPGHSGIRLTRRGRVTLVLLIAAGLLAAFWLGTWRAGFAGTGDAPRSITHDAVVLRPGQTLWEVATRHQPHADPRRIVDRLVELNDLPSVSVHAGQRILLPAPE